MAGTERLTPAEAGAVVASSHPPVILDVRAPKEYAQVRIPGAVNIPLNHLRERLGELPANRRVLVHCAGGYRSSIAAGILQQHGIDVLELSGGIGAWEAAGLAVLR
jgi:rhodanese-related sulfurtransferase